MKRIFLAGLAVAVLGLLGISLAIPALAHEPSEKEVTFTNHEVWDDMHDLCEVGERGAMVEAVAEIHGKGFGYMPCHDEGYHTHEDEGQVPTNHWDGMWDHMGDGMMHW